MACAATLAGCSSGNRASADGPTPGPPELVAPTADTSVVPGGGTWATVAMGHLGDPANTFWQLLHSPNGTTGWTDRVGATQVATETLELAHNGFLG